MTSKYAGKAGLLMAVLVVVGVGVYYFTPHTAVSPTTDGDYTSMALGFRFQYNPHPDEQNVIRVKEIGNKIYLSVNDAPAETGQFVERFTKDRDETFEASIRRQILARYPSPLCKIEITPSNIQGGYQVAEITYPKPVNESDPWFSNYQLCNPDYDQTNGLRYFLYNPQYPDRFAFVSIGQYAILAREGTPWQYTLTFIEGTANLWQTTIDQDSKLTFQYPTQLTTTYLHVVQLAEIGSQWPPAVGLSAGPFQCAYTARMVDGRKYCVRVLNEGAAGSTYSSYTYTTPWHDQVLHIEFTIRSVQCANYDDPQKTACEREREAFDLDAMVDRIARSVKQ